mmetsp:Transcript_20780/g.20136  ORF Transcript_20780/g.20136 Transcript_20780/m.20136 type:complete len:114 (+) Transcript_20780:125-466(+)
MVKSIKEIKANAAKVAEKVVKITTSPEKAVKVSVRSKGWKMSARKLAAAKPEEVVEKEEEKSDITEELEDTENVPKRKVKKHRSKEAMLRRREGVKLKVKDKKKSSTLIPDDA